MSLDYGIRSKGKRLPLLPVMGVALVVVGGGYGLFTHLHHRSQQVARAEAWEVEAPPCPTTTAAAMKEELGRRGKPMEFYGVKFLRKYGYADCGTVADSRHFGFGVHAVCAFSAPAVLQVRTETGDYYFAPGVAQPATVSIIDGKANCVMGARPIG